MKIGLYLRNMGPHATRENLLECARAADALPIDDLWVFDHVAIPPEDSEGSGGLYVDPLATLAFIAAVTERIGIGTGVLVLPYRPALLVAKWVASIQTLCAGRLSLGVGVGWMDAEFRALGVPRSRRGAITDETLEFLNDCFASDEVEVNGQRFLFLPRPKRPPIFVGGSGPHALRRAATLADGWMPGNLDPEALREPIAELRALAKEAGRPSPEVVVLGRLREHDEQTIQDRIPALSEVGVTRLAVNFPYANVAEFRHWAERVARLVSDARA
jgi:probable F420-dependent oxidoreductase